MNVADMRKEYTQQGLSEHDVSQDPIEQFQRWFAQALAANVHEPNAMTLATVDARQRPTARIVLLKGVDTRGFAFYTNYESHKAAALAAHPYAALIFYWPELERQVRIEGSVSKVAASEADTYYHSRPLGSRLGAWSSPQSQVIPNREFLEGQVAQMQAQFATGNPPRPPFWGGYRVSPDYIEFWQGRPSRLHDRICYHLTTTGWQIDRLAP